MISYPDESDFRTILDNTTALIQSVSYDGEVIYTNRTWRETLDYNENEPLSINFFDVVHSEYREKCRYLFQCLKRGEKNVLINTILIDRNGSNVRIEGTLFRSCPGRTKENVLGVFQSVSTKPKIQVEHRHGEAEPEHLIVERSQYLKRTNATLVGENSGSKRVEEKVSSALFESEQIFQTVAGGMRIVDLGFRVIKANETIAMMSGRKIEKINGTYCYDSFPGEFCHTEMCSLERIKKGQSILGSEVQKKGADGRTIPCLLTAKPFVNSEGKIIGIVEDFRDITEWRRLESLAGAINTMNNIGYVFSGIRHELGNPINNMKMAITVLRDHPERFSRTSVNEHIEWILKEISRVEYLLRSLKSFNMFESVKIEKIEIKEFLESFVSIANNTFINRPLVPELRLSVGARCVYADRRALQQVLLNLLTNALDALEQSDDPIIRFCVVRDEKYTKISVEDNGVGMTPRLMRDLFKPFHTHKDEGTGLGLVIVKKALANMNGTVDIESTPGYGTRVNLYLPDCSDEINEEK